MSGTMMGNTMQLGDSDDDDDDAKPGGRRVAPARGARVADARAEAKSARGGADAKGGAGMVDTWESDDDEKDEKNDPMNATVYS